MSKAVDINLVIGNIIGLQFAFTFEAVLEFPVSSGARAKK
jgi:hypothetical protein